MREHNGDVKMWVARRGVILSRVSFRWYPRFSRRRQVRRVATNDDEIAQPHGAPRSVSRRGIVAEEDFDDHRIDSYQS